ncbi:uncharacterized protein LOC119586915 [Penaeus monodon]|uniref:uncharacterized protein LOC119586915 n=1 Tax=Penaeus monodon TaxID=6687 RepID=UPI0018A6E7FD|nr:uncharacterized protein LOC119586915 [Penaeus monodon]
MERSTSASLLLQTGLPSSCSRRPLSRIRCTFYHNSSPKETHHLPVLSLKRSTLSIVLFTLSTAGWSFTRYSCDAVGRLPTNSGSHVHTTQCEKGSTAVPRI